MPESLEQLENEAQEIKDRLETLRDVIQESNVSDLTDIITKSGKLKGELTRLTPKQYLKLYGKPARESIIVKDEYGQDHIPWHLALDEIATERGFKSDEELKQAIEQVQDHKEEYDKLRARFNGILDDIEARELTSPKIETIKGLLQAPAFPDDFAPAEITTVDGLTLSATRQHSYWQLSENDKPVANIRYAQDARKAVKDAAEEYQESLDELQEFNLAEREEAKKSVKRHKRKATRQRRQVITAIRGMR